MSGDKGLRDKAKERLATLLRCPSCKSADVILVGEAKHSECCSCGHKFTWTAMSDDKGLPEKVQQADEREPTNWKGVRWIDSIKARNLAEEIGLHFAHDCNDSMCGEDADASNCEVAWIEDKLSDFLDAQVKAHKGAWDR